MVKPKNRDREGDGVLWSATLHTLQFEADAQESISYLIVQGNSLRRRHRIWATGTFSGEARPDRDVGARRKVLVPGARLLHFGRLYQ